MIPSKHKIGQSVIAITIIVALLLALEVPTIITLLPTSLIPITPASDFAVIPENTAAILEKSSFFGEGKCQREHTNNWNVYMNIDYIDKFKEIDYDV